MQTPAKPQQKSYRKGSSLYFSAGLVVSMVLIITAFEWKTPHETLADGGVIEAKDSGIDIIDFKPTFVPEKPKPKSISSEITTTEDDITPDIDIDITPPDIEVPEGTEGDSELDPNVLFGNSEPEGPVTDMPDYSEAAVPAQGYEAFYAYLYNNLRIPDHLISQNRDGKVQVSFVVDTDGTLTDIKIVRGFDKKLEEQIIKLLQEAPAWEPAWQQGRKVKMRMQLPVAIKINN
ncbi:energy transducer TonB [Cesiribacter sp. SM1]|uniref:energy transducer TonB n=1 Tax=Cesiribacter sp. SM1 TaxID=2861196 RepID=UPI001CD6005B|nr:TonB family protein [Cesiribacter sp. SM1]